MLVIDYLYINIFFLLNVCLVNLQTLNKYSVIHQQIKIQHNKVSNNQKTNKKILKNKIKKNCVKAKNRQQTKYTRSCNQKYVRKWGWRMLLFGHLTVAESRGKSKGLWSQTESTL